MAGKRNELKHLDHIEQQEHKHSCKHQPKERRDTDERKAFFCPLPIERTDGMRLDRHISRDVGLACEAHILFDSARNREIADESRLLILTARRRTLAVNDLNRACAAEIMPATVRHHVEPAIRRDVDLQHELTQIRSRLRFERTALVVECHSRHGQTLLSCIFLFHTGGHMKHVVRQEMNRVVFLMNVHIQQIAQRDHAHQRLSINDGEMATIRLLHFF